MRRYLYIYNIYILHDIYTQTGTSHAARIAKLFTVHCNRPISLLQCTVNSLAMRAAWVSEVPVCVHRILTVYSGARHLQYWCEILVSVSNISIVLTLWRPQSLPRNT